MADSIREKIIANIKTVLATITTANGYVNQMASVQRFDDRSNTTFAAPYTIIIPEDENKEPEPETLYTCQLPINLDVFIRQDEDDVMSTDERINSILADVEKAIMADHTRGGFAITTDILGNSPFSKVEGQPNSGITVRILVEYQHLRTDPTQTG